MRLKLSETSLAIGNYFASPVQLQTQGFQRARQNDGWIDRGFVTVKAL